METVFKSPASFASAAVVSSALLSSAAVVSAAVVAAASLALFALSELQATRMRNLPENLKVSRFLKERQHRLQ